MTPPTLPPGFDPVQVRGRVARLAGPEVEVRGIRLQVGDALRIHAASGGRLAEVVGLAPGAGIALLLDDGTGIAQGDLVSRLPAGPAVRIGPELAGRVIDGLGRPLDARPPAGGEPVTLEGAPPPALARSRISEPLPVGVRAVDALCTVGRGQRMGIFAGSGVGKSTLLGMMARGTAADVNVLALVGERGREVREFLEDVLGEAGRARTVTVVATSDQPALLRVRAAKLATRIAEWFADDGADVLLMMDSLTRLAMAQREIGLAAGEPPTVRGYTPSVFAMLPGLLERAGPRAAGTVTGFYTVLVEGDDLHDPIADTARSILDGHIVLDRRLAVAGHYPAIEPLESLSRVAPRVVSAERLALARDARAALAAVAEVRELVEVGAYAAGSSPAADRGLALAPALSTFLAQGGEDASGFDATWERLATIVGDGPAP